MLCISIAQESRRLAVVDLWNAAPQCDLMEIHLDRFKNVPDVRELVALKRKPAIFLCRRPQDGGQWSGTEDERLALLRQAVVDGADYIDIELDAASKIRKFPGCKRIISIIDQEAIPADLESRHAEALAHEPDLIHITTRADSLEAAMPLLKLLSRPKVPVVVHAVGKAGVMVNLMARRLGAPWIYAALERGMEVYPEQPTVHELETVYHVRSVGPRTPLFGVAGLSEREYCLVAGVNAGLAWNKADMRCWPFRLDNPAALPSIVRQFKLTGVLAGADMSDAVRRAAEVLDPLTEETGVVDLLLPDNGRLRGTSTFGAAVVEEVLATLRTHDGSRRPLEGRTAMVVGTGPLARLITRSLQGHGAIPIFSSRDADAARDAAKYADCRHVPFEGLYSTLHDVLIVCEETKAAKTASHRVTRADPIRPGYLRPGMAVVDVSQMPQTTELLTGAAERGCLVVEPRSIISREAGILLWELCGQEMDYETLESVLDNLEPANVA